MYEKQPANQYYSARLIRDFDGHDEFLMTNDERMTIARSPKKICLERIPSKELFMVSSFDIGEFLRHSPFLDSKTGATFVISPLLR